MKKRVFLIVLDSFGIGELPDADRFGDVGSNTLKSCFDTGILNIPNMIKLGLGNIEGCSYLEQNPTPLASYGRMRERSLGKDTTTGHWEIAGLISEKPFPTYPEGFPDEILDAFTEATGRGVLCNKPYSGTEVIKDYGDEHERSGKLIVYTSADSVFQIAANEDVVPLGELYNCCLKARSILKGEHAVGRVIARPFIKTEDGEYKRTANRHDFSLVPPKPTMLDAIKRARFDVISVGKISDIFAGEGITEAYSTKSNSDGMKAISEMIRRDFEGLCFVNLVDFDQAFGHRNDAIGYASALNDFDIFLGELLERQREGDLLIITADHGCDPATPSTDHSREYVPIFLYGKSVPALPLGTRESFTDVAKTVCRYLGVDFSCEGRNMLRAN